LEVTLADFDVQRYARLGAEARLAELRAEMDAIQSAFPDLGRARPGRKPGRGAALEMSGSVRTSKRPTMTAAQRKAVSERMKRYWANRRKNTK
jgi:hypothetical protein